MEILFSLTPYMVLNGFHDWLVTYSPRIDRTDDNDKLSISDFQGYDV